MLSLKNPELYPRAGERTDQHTHHEATAPDSGLFHPTDWVYRSIRRGKRSTIYQKRKEKTVFFALRGILKTSTKLILPPTELQSYHFHAQKGKHTLRGDKVPPKVPASLRQPNTSPWTPHLWLQAALCCPTWAGDVCTHESSTLPINGSHMLQVRHRRN